MMLCLVYGSVADVTADKGSLCAVIPKRRIPGDCPSTANRQSIAFVVPGAGQCFVTLGAVYVTSAMGIPGVDPLGVRCARWAVVQRGPDCSTSRGGPRSAREVVITGQQDRSVRAGHPASGALEPPAETANPDHARRSTAVGHRRSGRCSTACRHRSNEMTCRSRADGAKSWSRVLSERAQINVSVGVGAADVARVLAGRSDTRGFDEPGGRVRAPFGLRIHPTAGRAERDHTAVAVPGAADRLVSGS